MVGLTNGTFDTLDIIAMIIGFLISMIATKNKWFHFESNALKSTLSISGILILFFGNI